MKKYKILLFVLAVVMSTFMSAAAQFEKHFDPEQDTLISCDANPADYIGMTFDGDVYVLLNGCSDLKSTVIPGDNAFLTLRDIFQRNISLALMLGQIDHNTQSISSFR